MARESELNLATLIEAGLQTNGVIECHYAVSLTLCREPHKPNALRASVIGLALIGKLGIEGARKFVQRHDPYVPFSYYFMVPGTLGVNFDMVVMIEEAHRHLRWPVRKLVTILKAGKEIPRTSYSSTAV